MQVATMRSRESSEPTKITRILVLGMVSLEVQELCPVRCSLLRSFGSRRSLITAETDESRLVNRFDLVLGKKIHMKLNKLYFCFD